MLWLKVFPLSYSDPWEFGAVHRGGGIFIPFSVSSYRQVFISRWLDSWRVFALSPSAFSSEVAKSGVKVLGKEFASLSRFDHVKQWVIFSELYSSLNPYPPHPQQSLRGCPWRPPLPSPINPEQQLRPLLPHFQVPCPFCSTTTPASSTTPHYYPTTHSHYYYTTPLFPSTIAPFHLAAAGEGKKRKREGRELPRSVGLLVVDRTRCV